MNDLGSDSDSNTSQDQSPKDPAVDIERRRRVLKLMSFSLGALALGGEKTLGAGLLRLPSAAVEPQGPFHCHSTSTWIATDSLTTTLPATRTFSYTSESCPDPSTAIVTIGGPTISTFTFTQTIGPPEQTVTVSETETFDVEPTYTESATYSCDNGTVTASASESITDTITFTAGFSHSMTYTTGCWWPFVATEPESHPVIELQPRSELDTYTFDQITSVLRAATRKGHGGAFIPDF